MGDGTESTVRAMRFPIIPFLFYVTLITAIVFVIYQFQTSVDEAPFAFPEIFSLENVRLPEIALPDFPDFPKLEFSGPALGLNKLFDLFPPPKFSIREGIEVHSDNFCVWYNFETATYLKSHMSEKIPVTLTTFSTVNYLDVMYKQMQSWEGLVSYAVYFDLQSNQSPMLISWLHNCMKDVEKAISVHLVWPRNASASCEETYKQTALHPQDQLFDHEDCSQFSLQRALQFGRKMSVTVAFPTNTLKNVARIGAAGSILHFPVEIENLISKKAAAHIGQKVDFLMRKENTLKVIVVRQFEHELKDAAPTTVEELENMRQNDKAVMYHQMTNFRDHFVPELTQWIDYSRNKSNVNAELKQIDYRGPDWEPQLVVRAEDPLFFEGVNQQNIFGEELCRRGYEFVVISHVFTSRAGLEFEHEPLKIDDVTVRKRKEFYNYLDGCCADEVLKDECSKMLDVPDDILGLF